MNTKHTPGPWDLNETQRGTYIYQGGTENCIAEIYADVNEDQAANARLIAESPELLRCLEYLCNIVDRSPRLSDFDMLDNPGETASVMKSCRAAISKATQG